MKNRGPLLVVKTKLQRRLIWLVVVSMAIPTLLLGTLLLVQSGPPLVATISEERRVLLLLCLLVLVPVFGGVFLGWAFHLTNRMVGPVERMVQELDARLHGTASGPIILRPKDLLLPLSERINLVIAEWEKFKNAQDK